uniref:hypothetical protein n=1 Tax=Aliarcobacter cryaerophilus TaxID=28198 RepID=UPI001C64375C
RVTKLHGLDSRGHRKTTYYPDEISYLVKNPNMEYHIIIYNLKNNKNLNINVKKVLKNIPPNPLPFFKSCINFLIPILFRNKR